MATRANKERSVEEVFRDLLEQAALLGPFDPLALLSDRLSGRVKTEVLIRLGRVIEEQVVDGQPRWTLKAGERRRVIAGLADIGAARRIVVRAPPPKDDAFGQALQSALTGRDRSALPETDSLDEAYSARSFAIAAPYAARRRSADPIPVRHRIAAEQEAQRRRVVLPHGLYGRGKERDRIEVFLHIQGPPQGALLVTGVGGIGKSALIAAILNDALDDPRAPPVIVLDFDRPNLFRGDRIEIAREITRQIGRQRPRQRAKLAEARAQFSDIEADTDSSVYAMQQSAVLSLLGTALDPKLGTVAIVLDTFEEVITRGPEAVRDVLDWFESLRLSGGLAGMRLLVSGRSAPALPSDEMKRRFVETLELEGLAPKDGAALLREDAEGRKLFSAAKARRAAKALQGHPQALRLLRRYATDHADEVDGIIRDGLKEGAFGVRFAQVFLYTRILGRIRDRDVARLAHPGLVLRRVTPQLVQQVLAEPCGFGTIDEHRARDLFDRLAANVWVVDHTDRLDVVVHRRELRRLMLPGMMNPDPNDPEKVALRDMAKKIHRDAAEWYRLHRDTTSDAEAQDIEAFYHRASVDPDAVTPLEIERFAGALGEGLGDLPSRVQAIAKVVSGRAEGVSEDEFELLPADLQEAVRRQTERAALRRGDTASIKRTSAPRGTSDASAVVGPRASVPPATAAKSENVSDGASPRPAEAPPPPATFAEAEDRFGPEILARWTDGDLEGVVEVADRAYDRLWQKGSRETLIRSRHDPIYWAVWKSLVARCVTGDWPEALIGDDSIARLAKLYPDAEAQRDTTSGMITPLTLHVTAVALACNASHGAAVGRIVEFGEFLRSRRWLEQVLEPGLHGPFALRSAELAATCVSTPGLKAPHSQVSLLRSLLRLLTPPYAQLFLHYDTSGMAFDQSHSSKGGRPGVSSEWELFPPGYLEPATKALHEELKGGAPALVPMEVLNRLLRRAGDSLLDGALVIRLASPRKPRPELECRLVELFDPVVGALFTLGEDPAVLARLATVSERALIWPQELHPDTIMKSPLHEHRRKLVEMVDFADQSGLLAELVERAAEIAPNNARIATATKLVARAEAIFH